ncbi:hypothetical protein SCHPADRAFT_563690 [Schizopora paradoxa]|uniref:GDP/GTP exchange factor Sec2 N-terminal domain-containing protein n=1 Tax=Schizopora paradoxa TaxID=27342 RepID=A0A0H2RXL7_9AGAM|nr:hypothetical protein SCHPADRAFT_563690 [Schizopora paradoxa]
MLSFPAHQMVATNGKPVPSRSDSLKQPADTTSALLAALPDELRDFRRVRDYGQEEDMKYALGRCMERIEQLSALLSSSQKSHDELETTLKLAKSNLQLALANNEMLEDALKRESASGGKDLGWRRSVENPDQRRVRGAMKGSSLDRQSTDGLSPSSSQIIGSPLPSSSPLTSSFTPSSDSSGSTPTSPAMLPPVSPQPQHTPQPSASSQDTRFFRFRFGGGSSSPNLSSSASKGKPPSRPQSPQPQAFRKSGLLDSSHLTSASLPSLSSESKETELLAELEAERTKSITVAKEKANLEAELEGLSQALFEEANKMVAQERIKCAEMEEELKQTQREKDAIKSAMRIIEQENETLKKLREEGEKQGHADIVDSIAKALREDSHKSNPASPIRPRTPTIEKVGSESDFALKETQTAPADTSSLHPSDRLRDFTFPPRSWSPSNTALPASPLPDIPLEDSPWGK